MTDVAMVQDIQSVRNWSVRQHPGKPMHSRMGLTFEYEVSVATIPLVWSAERDPSRPQKAFSEVLADQLATSASPEFGDSGGAMDGHNYARYPSIGYKGIYDNLSRDDFNRLGSFSVVWLTG